MEHKLTDHIESLFRDAPNTAHNREIKEEILQNTLDRFHDDMAGGMDEERAYQRAVSSVGDVESLLEGVKAPKTKKHRTGWTIFAAAVAVIAVVLALSFAGGNRREKENFQPTAVNDHVTTTIGEIEDSVGKMADQALAGEFLVDGASYSYTYDHAEDYTSGNVSFTDETIEELEIHWPVGEVRVIALRSDELEVKGSGNLEKDEDRLLHWRLQDGKLTIQPCAPGTYTEFPETLRIRIPQKMAKNLKILTVETVSAETHFSDLKVETVDLTGTSGKFFLTDVNCDSLSCKTTSGGLVFTGIVENAAFDTDSGCGSLDFNWQPRRMDFASISGNLSLHLPKAYSFEARLDTTSGALDTDFPAAVGEGVWTYEGSDSKPPAQFNCRTVSGDVEIRKK